MTNVDMIKELREITGMSVGKCNEALKEASGVFDDALKILQQQMTRTDAARVERKCSKGRVMSYIHGEGRIGVLLQVDCESDFVARADKFKEFMHEVCLQIAGMRPLCVSRADIPVAQLAIERTFLLNQAAQLKKPEFVREKIVEGQMEKWFREICLVDQAYIKDGSKSIGQLLNELVQLTGEKIEINRFSRFEAGA